MSANLKASSSLCLSVPAQGCRSLLASHEPAPQHAWWPTPKYLVIVPRYASLGTQVPQLFKKQNKSKENNTKTAPRPRCAVWTPHPNNLRQHTKRLNTNTLSHCFVLHTSDLPRVVFLESKYTVCWLWKVLGHKQTMYHEVSCRVWNSSNARIRCLHSH